jgi:hypothetical protein
MKSASAISHSNSNTEVLVSKSIILKVGKGILTIGCLSICFVDLVTRNVVYYGFAVQLYSQFFDI